MEHNNNDCHLIYFYLFFNFKFQTKIQEQQIDFSLVEKFSLFHNFINKNILNLDYAFRSVMKMKSKYGFY